MSKDHFDNIMKEQQAKFQELIRQFIAPNEISPQVNERF